MMTPSAARPFTLRPARPGDLPAAIALIRELAAFEKLAGPDDEEAARLQTDFAAGRYRLLVVEDEAGALCAYAMYYFTYSSFRARPTLYLEDVYVTPARRGHGIGEAVLRHLGEVARAEGCARFEWVVLDWNVGAQDFYRRLGARILDEWRVCRVDGEALDRL